MSLGYDLLATDGTWRALRANGVPCERINKVHEGRPHIVDAIKNREIDVVLNTPYGKQQRHDDSYIRSSAVNNGVPCITTLAGARALVSALSALHRGSPEVRSIQDHHAKLPQTAAQPETAPAG